jgi:hypothetical protein
VESETVPMKFMFVLVHFLGRSYSKSRLKIKKLISSKFISKLSTKIPPSPKWNRKKVTANSY